MARGVILSSIVLIFFVLSKVAGGDEVCRTATYDYKDALSKAILFFEGQKSGKLPPTQRVKWRGDSALSDGKQDNVELIGGYYDAGNNVKFGWPMAFTVTLLSWAAVENPMEISSAGQMDYFRQAIRWGTDFILQSHTSPTTFYTRVGDGDRDHACWECPEEMDTSRTLYKITSSSPGSEAAAQAAAALSAASIVFKTIDSNYSSKLFTHSEYLFELADQYRGSYKCSCPFYRSSGYQDELTWAAAWLYKASGKDIYLNYVTSNQGWSQAVSEFSWDNKFAGVQALLAQEFYDGKSSLEMYKRDANYFICALLPGSGSVQFHTIPGNMHMAAVIMKINIKQSRCPGKVFYMEECHPDKCTVLCLKENPKGGGQCRAGEIVEYVPNTVTTCACWIPCP